MREQSKGKKAILWIAGIVVFLTVAGIAGWHFLKKDLSSNNPKAKPIIKNEMKTVVAKASDSLYKIDYSDFKLNIDSGFATMSNVKIAPDPAIYNKLVAEKKAPDNVLSLTVGRMAIQNFKFDKTNGNHTLHIGKIEMDNPTIRVTNELRPYNDTSNQSSVIGKLIGNALKKQNIVDIGDMKIDEVVMKNTNFVYVNNNDRNSRSTVLRKLDITINNVSTSNSTGKDSDSNKIALIKIGHQRILTADRLYYIDFNNMQVLPEKKSVYIGSFTLTPTVSKKGFYKIVSEGKANYRYTIKYTGLTMADIDFDRLFKKQQIFVGSVTANDSWAEFYTNYNWPLRTPPNRRDKYPHELLQRLAFDVNIRRMTVKHGTIIYRIVAKKSQREAVVTMNDIRSDITNITNNAAAKKENPYATVVSQLKLMNRGTLHDKMELNLVDKNAPFTISSTLGPMNGTALNPLAEPLGMMHINSLNIEKMQMNMKGDEYTAKGNIDYYYKDMKVQLLKRDDKNDTLKKRGVISFFTNAALRNDNPKKNGKFRKGPINIVRAQQESFFGFIWRGMLDGLSSATSGFNQKKAEPQNIAIDMGTIFAGPKRGPEEKSAGTDMERLNNLKKSKKHKKQ